MRATQLNQAMKVAIFGLGYVGMPLAVALAKTFDAIGFDIDHKRVGELRRKLSLGQTM